MTAQQVLTELKGLSTKTTQNTFANHSAPLTNYGVKVADLKKIQKSLKKNYELSLELFDSGISDAQYLAGLIADETKMTKKDLQHWADKAGWYLISEYTVPWIAAESNYGYELGLQWINAEEEGIQSSGWTTWASLVSIKQDDDLPIETLKVLLGRVKKDIYQSRNRVRYAMNTFVISVGCYVKELTAEAQETGKVVGKIKVDMGKTACTVPYAPDYIQKAIDKGTVGKKKSGTRC